MRTPYVEWNPLESAVHAAEHSIEQAAALALSFPGVSSQVLASIDPVELRRLLEFARRALLAHTLDIARHVAGVEA